MDSSNSRAGNASKCLHHDSGSKCVKTWWYETVNKDGMLDIYDPGHYWYIQQNLRLIGRLIQTHNKLLIRQKTENQLQTDHSHPIIFSGKVTQFCCTQLVIMTEVQWLYTPKQRHQNELSDIIRIIQNCSNASGSTDIISNKTCARCSIFQQHTALTD